MRGVILILFKLVSITPLDNSPPSLLSYSVVGEISKYYDCGRCL